MKLSGVLPYKVRAEGGGIWLVDWAGAPVARMVSSLPDAEEQARYLAKAANNYPALLTAAETMKYAMRDALGSIEAALEGKGE